jgi:thiol:disulfide interchange protein DsbC
MFKKTTFIVVFIFALVFSLQGFQHMAFGEEGGTLTKEEAKTILQELAPQVEIISVAPSIVKGLWEVAAEAGGKKTVVYIDSSKRNIVLGSIINLDTKANVTKDKYDELTRIDVSKIPLEGSIVLGDPKAKTKAFVFTDPDCPFCVKLHPELKKVVEQRKDIVFYIKLYPLPMHPDAYGESKSIACEKANQKALQMLENVYEKKEIPKTACDTKVIDDNMKLGKELGVDGTPTIIFENGKRASGAKSAADLIGQIDQNKDQKK